MKKESKPMNKFLKCFFINFDIGLFITSICILFANNEEINNESIFMLGVFMSTVWGMLSLMRKEAEMELENKDIQMNAGYKPFHTECGASGYVGGDHIVCAYPGDSSTTFCFTCDCEYADKCIFNNENIHRFEYVYGWDEADRILGLNRFDGKEEDV